MYDPDDGMGLEREDDLRERKERRQRREFFELNGYWPAEMRHQDEPDPSEEDFVADPDSTGTSDLF